MFASYGETLMKCEGGWVTGMTSPPMRQAGRAREPAAVARRVAFVQVARGRVRKRGTESPHVCVNPVRTTLESTERARAGRLRGRRALGAGGRPPRRRHLPLRLRPGPPGAFTRPRRSAPYIFFLWYFCMGAQRP
jgi:hypothetical protein